jgi:hypothetical protein
MSLTMNLCTITSTTCQQKGLLKPTATSRQKNAACLYYQIRKKLSANQIARNRMILLAWLFTTARAYPIRVHKPYLNANENVNLRLR